MVAKRPINKTLTNSADPDQAPRKAASDQGLYHLPKRNGYFSLSEIKMIKMS